MKNLLFVAKPSQGERKINQCLTKQGCQMVASQNLNLGIFWALEWTMLVYFMANWNILRPFGIFYRHSVYIVVIRYIFSLFVYVLYQEKSGNPAHKIKAFRGSRQSCQIFLFTMYQNGGKYTKLPQIIKVP
jgi:hypothetical protein